MLSQMVFTTHAKAGLTHEDYRVVGLESETLCKSLGFTGRIFVNEMENFNIIEGEADRVQKYFSAFYKDARIKLVIPHFSRDIKTREFKDYQVWGYHSGIGQDFHPQVNQLTALNFESSTPQNLSLKLRILLEGYVFESVKTAA